MKWSSATEAFNGERLYGQKFFEVTPVLPTRRLGVDCKVLQDFWNDTKTNWYFDSLCKLCNATIVAEKEGANSSRFVLRGSVYHVRIRTLSERFSGKAIFQTYKTHKHCQHWAYVQLKWLPIVAIVVSSQKRKNLLRILFAELYVPTITSSVSMHVD